MSAASSYPFWATLLSQLPTLAASIVGLVLTLAFWQKSPAASPWALAAFLLAFLLCFAPFVTQFVAQSRTTAGGYSYVQIVSALSLIWSVVRAASYGLLLVAVYAGRSRAAVSAFPVQFPPGP